MWDRIPLYNIESEAGCKLMVFLRQHYESRGYMFAVVFGLSSFYRKCLLLSLCHAHIFLLMRSHMVLPRFSFSSVACSSDSTVPNDLSFSCFLFPLFHKVCCCASQVKIFTCHPHQLQCLGDSFSYFLCCVWLCFCSIFLRSTCTLVVLFWILCHSFQAIHSSLSLQSSSGCLVMFPCFFMPLIMALSSQMTSEKDFY